MADSNIVRLQAARLARPVRLTLDLSASLAQDVEAYAATHGLARCEALRYLLEAGLLAEAQAMSEHGAG